MTTEEQPELNYCDTRTRIFNRASEIAHLREWDFCDQCIFFRTCLRPERANGDGCFEAFYPYPYSTFTDEQIAMKSRMLLGLK